MTTATGKMTLRDAIRDIVRSAGTIEDSVLKVRELLDDPDARAEAAPDLAKLYAADIVYQARYRLRQLPSESWLSPERTKALAESGRRLGLFTDYTVGDKHLGECTRDELLESADMDGARANGYAVSSKFKRTLASKMSGAKTVAQCWKEADATKLLRKIGGEK